MDAFSINDNCPQTNTNQPSITQPTLAVARLPQPSRYAVGLCKPSKFSNKKYIKFLEELKGRSKS